MGPLSGALLSDMKETADSLSAAVTDLKWMYSTLKTEPMTKLVKSQSLGIAVTEESESLIRRANISMRSLVTVASSVSAANALVMPARPLILRLETKRVIRSVLCRREMLAA